MRRDKKAADSFDVARLAGVSRSAVSRAFTPGASIARQTREQVLAAASRLGYRPNALARTLNTRRSRIIGVVMSEITNPFYAHLLEVISQKLQAVDLTLLLFSAKEAGRIDELVPRLLQYQVDGVLITSATLSSAMARQCAAAGTPVVLVNRYVRDARVSSVCCDNAAAGRMVAELLVKAGHRRIGFVAGIEDTSSSRDRERGFVAGLAAAGLRLAAREVGNYAYDAAAAAARRMLGCRRRPSAVFAANDVMATAVIDIARGEAGLVVPQDLSVVGFDNTPLGATLGYALTSVDQNVEAMAAQAIDTLCAHIEDAALATVRRLVPCRLEARESVASPAGFDHVPVG